LHIPGFATAAAAATDDGQRALLLLICSGLVLVMALGSVLFYVPLSRPVLNRILASVVLTAVLWMLGGYGLVFGSAVVPGFLGTPLGLLEAFAAADGDRAEVFYTWAFALFQCSVAILTVTIVTAVVATRIRRVPWLGFIGAWFVLVYIPLAHTVFNTRDGWLFDGLQVVDQAGGIVVYISSGAALLAVLVVTRGASQQLCSPRLRTKLGGIALLWLGTFGLNFGSEGVVDGLFTTIFVNTLIAPLVAAIAWAVVEVLMRGKPTLHGVTSGILTGIVAITPACGILTPLWTLGLAALAGGACAAIVAFAHRTINPSGSNVVGIHLIAGTIGIAYIGLFGNGVGWKDSGQPTGLADQFAAALGAAMYSFAVAFIIVWVLRRTNGLRNETNTSVTAARVLS
jgi:Amt family ammonium transporter